MNVAHKGKKIGLFLAKNRFVAVLKEMPAPLVTTIEILGIPRRQNSRIFSLGIFGLKAQSKSLRSLTLQRRFVE
jgi:hypothetical protein